MHVRFQISSLRISAYTACFSREIEATPASATVDSHFGRDIQAAIPGERSGMAAWN